jgi:glycosyltransferase involved in cell wall biosynthesis
LHSHGYHSDLVAWRAARRLGAGLVSTVHGFTGGDVKNRIYERLDRWMLRRFDRVVAVSGAGAAGLLRTGVQSERLRVIRNAFRPPRSISRRDARELLGLEPDGVVIGWVGRFTTVKGPDLLIEALAGVPETGWRAVMVGDGPDRGPCERRAREAGFPDARLRFAGARPDAGRLMKAFDLLVLSSRSEGVPMVLLEAVDAGTPIVAHAVGGIPEVLPASCGWLVAPEEPGGLARGIAAALADPPEAARRSEAARQAVLGALSFDRWIEAYAETYRSLHGPSKPDTVEAGAKA